MKKIIVIYDLKKNVYRFLTICRAWISGRDSRPKFRNPFKKNHEGARLPPWKTLLSGNFCLYEMKHPISEKFTSFSEILDSFLVQAVIFYCWIEVIVFRFYQELNVIWSENLELSRGISRILPVFSKVTLYLCKIIVDLKNLKWGEKVILQ